MFSLQSEPPLRARSGRRTGHKKVDREAFQVKPAIEAVRELRQITARIFGEIKRMIGSGQSRLQISQNRVDPVELGKIPGFSASRFFREVESQHGKGGKAGQTIRNDGAPRRQKCLSPGLEGLLCEPGNRRELGVHRMSILIGRHRRDKGDLVFRAPSPFSSRMLSAQVRIVDFDPAFQRIQVFPAGHGFHELVLDAPGRAVTDSQLAFERQGGKIVLRLAHQVDGQKPGGERELGAVKEGSGNQGGLLVAHPALERLPGADMQYTVKRALTTGTPVSVRPSDLFKGRFALFFRAVQTLKFRKGKSLLKLDAIHGHFEPPSVKIGNSVHCTPN